MTVTEHIFLYIHAFHSNYANVDTMCSIAQFELAHTKQSFNPMEPGGSYRPLAVKNMHNSLKGTLYNTMFGYFS